MVLLTPEVVTVVTSIMRSHDHAQLQHAARIITHDDRIAV